MVADDVERHPSDGWAVLPFENAPAFEAWLDAHHTEEPGVWVKLAKKASGVPSISYAETVEVALCFGWIDSKGLGYDATYHLLRCQPRRPRSNWSASNKERSLASPPRGACARPGSRRSRAPRQTDGGTPLDLESARGPRLGP